ncbi:MAG: GtrA family protein [Anaerolineae bacterium]|nr:GtrA family protein [Anaerolineae bacterium]
MTIPTPVHNWIAANQKELTRFLKFAVVGAIGAVVDFGILYLMHRVIGLSIVPANTISFTCAVISNFTWNRYWTYPDSRSKPLKAQLGQFFIVNILGWAINTGILTLLKDPLTAATASLLPALMAKTAYTIGYNSAKVVATGVVMFWNFFVNRFWTYNDVK